MDAGKEIRMRRLRAPFPWFGGKSRVSAVVWDHIGDVRNYVEPFFGSGAVLLGRPGEPKIETVNDLDCWVANFWRALQQDQEGLAAHADWPVNEADLHARHLWLMNQIDFRDRIKTDPDYYDVKIAGWWVWGICQWIGSGWCATSVANGTARKRPFLSNHGGGMGVHVPALITPGRTNTGRVGRGIHAGTVRKRPRLGNDHGRGVLCADVPHQIPDLSGDSGAAGRGIHASGRAKEQSGLLEWFEVLANRLRRVRVCCGDWNRVLGPAPTTCIGTTGVFLDPPYAVEERSDVYGEESRAVAHDVREWAIANGENPELRIALCGYEGEHQMPESWTEIAWKAQGGYANQSSAQTVGKANAHRERIWFSPFCLRPQESLFRE
jgi:site-specific DNA-adenine methylase